MAHFDEAIRKEVRAIVDIEVLLDSIHDATTGPNAAAKEDASKNEEVEAQRADAPTKEVRKTH